ncbi:plasmid partitioning protein RepB C-terminal domain-containing protein [Sphingopyxis sp. RIFCSPHIGHO2_12_FULL_65_19]|uniref:plasmid partitioning protein RepB C-terminal domain-containing protein n=1 Tax=Sphingopyxis sp. RIFCSPHIGHO2_12_FULL_65_19 TaxID=1802172 RepID=UPI0008C51142|nr:plasmid partitioning protein RepB C-terminal domain-containing protein [Sphingopyxis sp. RIFCSPHIGHO2_12_FULL_65_19]OHD05239.1 MAG: chromosome partitioning protein ParB [Sphingopyxis sp. RIFCSPHIGHO2_12_FULL_65_19]
MALPAQRVEMIPIDRITIVNPRLRNKKVFKGIVENIADIGLKRPITVTSRQGPDGPLYDLVCGQGRLEAFRQLGQTDVPALIVTADAEDCLVASLVENCARRQHQGVDLLQDIVGMRKRGYADSEIAEKTGLTTYYVSAIARLLERGERRLVAAVEAGYLPISVALEICESDDQGVQAALHKAYEGKLLRGRSLIAARRLVEVRKRSGKSTNLPNRLRKETMTPEALVKAFQEDTERKRLMIKKTEATRNRLVFIVEALGQLANDDTFVVLLEDEGLETMPNRLAERIHNTRVIAP